MKEVTYGGIWGQCPGHGFYERQEGLYMMGDRIIDSKWHLDLCLLIGMLQCCIREQITGNTH